MSLITPTREPLKAVNNSILLKFTKDFIQKMNGKTILKRAEPLNRQSSGRKSSHHSKPRIIETLQKDKQVIQIFFLINKIIRTKRFLKKLLKVQPWTNKMTYTKEVWQLLLERKKKNYKEEGKKKIRKFHCYK